MLKQDCLDPNLQEWLLGIELLAGFASNIEGSERVVAGIGNVFW